MGMRAGFMKSMIHLIAASALMASTAMAEVRIDEKIFGDSLGGWKKRDKQAAEYPLSGATYRTYRPEFSPTPDGGIFVSVRIDHVRGWLSTDDHAILEVTINNKGAIVSARSNIAIQGRSISSDLIRGAGETGKAAVGSDRAVQIGTDLVANLSEKLLREKIVEAGRVSFPAALRHNYNRLFQAIRHEVAAPPTPEVKPEPEDKSDAAPTAPAEKPEEKPASGSGALEIKPYATPENSEIPAAQ
ncbi:MAG: hypothetical protein B9S30_04085 [Verrucomicrobiia bacterium Tous-C5FEB]|nr:MAG: hypothetical protein B9S30_04085 [Verrucomicrobiae bacterium Tous-C5FEB]